MNKKDLSFDVFNVFEAFLDSPRQPYINTWILLSDRNPPLDGEYLAFHFDLGVTVLYWDGERFVDFFGDVYYDVVFWSPLPESPYNSIYSMQSCSRVEGFDEAPARTCFYCDYFGSSNDFALDKCLFDNSQKSSYDTCSNFKKRGESDS